MLNRRPPLTTLETRATWTTLSSRLSFEASILAIFPAFQLALEIQTYFTSAFCQRCHSPMISVATAIENYTIDALFFGTLSDEFANLSCKSNFAILGDSGQCLDWRFGRTFLGSREDCFNLSRLFATSDRSTLLRLRSLRSRLRCFCSLPFRRRLFGG